jgi:hypothetical protein
MNIRTRFAHLIFNVIIGTLAAVTAHAAEAPIQGRIVQITSTQVIMDEGPTLKFDPVAAQCFDPRGYRLTCETLIAVGYVDEARITMTGEFVTRIDIVRLQQ